MKIKDVTVDQGRKIAATVGTTWDSLRAVVYGHRGVSAERAVEIERAAKRIGLDIRRESLNVGCSQCEFARACRLQAKAAIKK